MKIDRFYADLITARLRDAIHAIDSGDADYAIDCIENVLLNVKRNELLHGKPSVTPSTKVDYLPDDGDYAHDRKLDQNEESKDDGGTERE